MVLQGHDSTRESFPRCVSEPLALISITLQGFADDGPSRPTFEHLVPYLRGNTCYVNIDFNIASGIERQSLSERLENLDALFESGELQRLVRKAYATAAGLTLPRFRRFFVFLSTHSDPERGDLHIAPGSQASAPSEQVKFLRDTS